MIALVSVAQTDAADCAIARRLHREAGNAFLEVWVGSSDLDPQSGSESLRASTDAVFSALHQRGVLPPYARRSRLAPATDVATDGCGLTPREREIIGLIDRGLSNKEIAALLSIRLATVKNHVHHILEKLGAHRRGEATAIVRTNGGGAMNVGLSAG